MADQFTEIATKGFGQRILGSIIGIPIGLALIIGGIGVLYWNEGRYDLSRLAKDAVEVQASQAAPSEAQGKLVAVKGTVNSNEQLGDTYLKPNAYLALQRTSEEFSWKEDSHTDSNNNTGGSQTNTTTYTYSTQWADDVPNSNLFKHPADHINPPKTIPSQLNRVGQATIGNYSLDFQVLDLPPFSAVTLDNTNAILAPNFSLTNDNKLYNGVSYTAPKVGDTRISYSALGNGFAGTVIGKLNGSSVSSYADAKNHRLYRLFSGSKQDALTTLHNEYRTKLWVFRGIGFLAILIGLTMLLGPLTTILSFFPTLGRVGSAAVWTIAFPIALMLSMVTIVVGMIAHNPLALAVTLVLSVAVSVYYIRHRSHKIALPPPAIANTPPAIV